MKLRYLFYVWYLIGLLLLLFWELPSWLLFANSIFMLLYTAAVLEQSVSLYREHIFHIHTLSLLIMIAAVTFLTEAISVLTGFPFGEYHYTTVLGAHLFGVPFTIAFAWVGFIVNAVLISTQKSKLLRAAEAGGWVVLIDLVLDPVALAMNFWQWQGGGFYYGIPLTNFISWFMLAGGLSFLLPKANSLQPKEKQISFRLLQLMLLFFGLLAFKEGLFGPGIAACLAILAAEGRKQHDYSRKKVMVH